MAKRKRLNAATVATVKKMVSEGKKRGEIAQALKKSGAEVPVSSLSYYLYALPRRGTGTTPTKTLTGTPSRLKKILEADFLTEAQRIELALKELG